MAGKISQWSGRSAQDMRLIYDSFSKARNFVPSLLKLAHEPQSQTGATWLLKHYLETDGTLTPDQSADFFGCLHYLQSWESKLHMLQSLSHVTIAQSQCMRLEDFLQTCIEDQNKFVRAWAYNGFFYLAKQYPKYQDVVRQRMEQAKDSESASIKARIRILMRAGF